MNPHLANPGEVTGHGKATKERKSPSETGDEWIWPAQLTGFCRKLKLIIKTAGLFTLPRS